MRQEVAVQKVVESLKEDPSIKSIFLKGSMGRQEYDQHSDVDLYCLIVEGEEESFLSRRLDHLKAYKPIMFYDDIFIIAPQIIAIYDDWLHIDLFTVTEKTFQEKDYFTVLYDPEGVMKTFEKTQNLTLSEEEYKDHVLDVAWFLFQYKKAAERGNPTWAPEMLRYTVRHLSNVLLYHHAKDRSVLGLKTIHIHLPHEKQKRIQAIYEVMTPSEHDEAARLIANLLDEEIEWIQQGFSEDHQTIRLLTLMIETYKGEKRHVEE